MQLSLYTDYALRVLIYLSIHQDRLSSIHEIATCYDISQNHLMKVVHHLGKADFISTVRGRRGGLKLNKPPCDITLGSIVRHTEDTEQPIKCGKCIIQKNCTIKTIIYDAFEAFYTVLDKYTLDCVLEDYDQLQDLLTFTKPKNINCKASITI
ncbi:DNA-binding transcriptional regulator [Commensalibacter communis]|uniref:IscR family (IscR) n=1 Tax=Commensalibacter communis TaxID=2972786 RepID=A0A9W4TLE0_9PROT|nr:Rrf2 family transcriptional regulator [Commensalibacter communis]CAI3925478.1 DNA-binding transcriptional regulator [Commensalibacter communis]CAI3926995.1 DNA-binding transcriptional regulator [Commensalibacter communis]CAI3927009.1 DNA-binding transcriptional regulator [Commensalibacter communis]CAI3927679.1 DNA-binding transcriptional regulator [Commensalibacter communis]CAI3927716.1 DNA-binding transcriptional regulator [Commensalibacter communis]